MSVSVVIPWRADSVERVAALNWVMEWWRVEHPGFEVVVAEHAGGLWCKADAVAEGLAATAGDTLIVADADVFCDGVADAVAAVATHGWAVPHLHVRRLTAEATAAVYRGEPPDSSSTLAQRPYVGRSGGGLTVLPRALYEAIPLDRRFVGWGQEDESWSLALSCLAGEPWRGDTDLWHLWHPPQPRMNRRYGSVASKALHDRYRLARNHPKQMRALIEEAGHEHRPPPDVAM